MRNGTGLFIGLLVIIGWSLLATSGAGTVGLPPERILYEKDSLYHHIRVSQVANYRYLSFNRARGNQSAVNVNDPSELKFAYTQASFLSLVFFEKEPESILYVGLGGGSMPRVMAKYLPHAKIDLVEIDPDVVMVAKKYFLFEPTPNMRIFEQDGRQFLRRSKDQYDLIVLDAYNDAAIPFHLTTQEFFELVKQRLTPRGVVATNIWGPASNEFYYAEIKTFQAIFPRVYAINAVSTNNNIFFVTQEDKEWTAAEFQKQALALHNRYRFPFALDLYARTFEDLTHKEVNAKVLLDDLAPVEVLRSREAGHP